METVFARRRRDILYLAIRRMDAGATLLNIPSKPVCTEPRKLAIFGQMINRIAAKGHASSSVQSFAERFNQQDRRYA
jgi:hypothetical protein